MPITKFSVPLMQTGLFVTASLLVGCASSGTLTVESVNIADETRIGELTKDEQILAIALSKGVDPDSKNIFNEAKAVTINGYRVLFSNNPSGALYIIKGKKIIASISENTQTIYLDVKDAPAIGTERVFIDGKYFKYSNGSYVFESHGLDGIDVVYKKFDKGENAVSYLNGVKCEYTIAPGMACCRDDAGNLSPYRFSPYGGWEQSENQRVIERCQSMEKPRSDGK